MPVLGVVPFLRDLGLPDEDAVAVSVGAGDPAPAEIDIAVIRLPRIANFDDFDPLRAEPGVRVRYVDDAARLGAAARGDPAGHQEHGGRPALAPRAGTGRRRRPAGRGRHGRRRHLRRLPDARPGRARPVRGRGGPRGRRPASACSTSRRRSRGRRRRTAPGPGSSAAPAGSTGCAGRRSRGTRSTWGGRPPRIRCWTSSSGEARRARCRTARRPATAGSGGVTCTGSSPTTPSGAPGWRRSPPGRGRAIGPEAGRIESALDRLADAVEAAVPFGAVERIVREGVDG